VPTHNRNHTLDFIIAHSSNSLISNINIVHPAFSDHATINFHIKRLRPPAVFKTVEHRSFTDIDASSFENDLLFTKLSKISLSYTQVVKVWTICSVSLTPPLKNLRKHTPRQKKKIHKKTNCPLFDKECLASKQVVVTSVVSCWKNLTTNEGNSGKLLSKLNGDFQHKRFSYLRRSIKDVSVTV